MSISLKKVRTLLKKDLIDFCKNPVSLISMLIPITMLILYKFIYADIDLGESEVHLPTFLMSMGVSMNTCMCGLLYASGSIAEEKEKLTLRTLMLSNIKGMEFLLSKVLVGFLFTMTGNFIVFFLLNNSLDKFGIYALAVFMGSLVLNLISAVVGILSRDQASSSVLQIPIMMLFIIPAMMGQFNKVLASISKFFPVNAMLNIYFGRYNIMLNIMVLIIWIVVCSVLFAWIYKKRGIDN